METKANTPSTSSQIPGPKILLMGDSGTGKTESLRTLKNCGITTFVIATEQNFLQVVKEDLGKTIHYKYISPQPASNWESILNMAKNINMLSFENLCKVQDATKTKQTKFMDLLTTCNNFVCDCCNKSWGSVNSWGTDRALALDSFSGTSDMAFNLVVGNKPVRSIPDYGVAQNALKMLLTPLTSEIRCTFILIAHIDREKDEITGGTTITVKSIGQKLGPDLPRLFSDVIRARRDGAKFTWDTADASATVVARHIPIASGQVPSFVPLIEKWKANGGKIEAASGAVG